MAETSEPSLSFGSFNQEDLMETEMSAVVLLPPSEGSVLVDFGSWTHEESLFYQQAHCADLELFTVEYVAAVRDDPPTPVPVPAPVVPRATEAPKSVKEDVPAKPAPVPREPAVVPVAAVPPKEPEHPKIAAPPSPKPAVEKEVAERKSSIPAPVVVSTPPAATAPKDAVVESVAVEVVVEQKTVPIPAEKVGLPSVAQADAGAQAAQAGPTAHAQGHHAYPMARHPPATEQQHPQPNGHAQPHKQSVGEAQVEKAVPIEVVAHSEPPKSPKPSKGKEKKEVAAEHPKPHQDTHRAKEHTDSKPKAATKQPALPEPAPQPPHPAKQPETPAAATAVAPEQTPSASEAKPGRDGHAAPTHPKASKPEDHKPEAPAPAKPAAHLGDRQGAQPPRPAHAHGRPQGHAHGAHAHTHTPAKGAEASGVVGAGGDAQAHGRDEHRAKGPTKRDGPVKPPSAPTAGAQPVAPGGPRARPQAPSAGQEPKQAWGRAAAVAPATTQPQSAWGRPPAAAPAKATPEPPAAKEEPAPPAPTPAPSTPQPSQPAPTASPTWGAAARAPAQTTAAPRHRTGPTPRGPPPSTGAPKPPPPTSSSPAPRPAATPSSPGPQADGGAGAPGAGRGVATPPPQSPQAGNAWRSGSPSIMSSPAPLKASPASAKAPQPAPAASPAPTPAQAPAPGQAKSSWTSLFPTNNAAASRSVGGQCQDRRTGGAHNKHESMAELLRDYKPEEHFVPAAYEPRGLVNTGNMCYIHSILQTMVGCRPMAGLLKELRQMQALPRLGAENENRATPVLDCMMQFFGELKGADTKETEVIHGKAFKPEAVYKMVESEWRNGTILGRQEDAQEFLTFLLDQLHEECLKLIKPLQKPNGEVKHHDEEDSAEWEEVGPRQKTTYARHNQMDSSPISAIFSTRMRSMLKIQNQPKSSTTYQPYNSLPLDIQSPEVRDVTHALAHLFDKETVDGYKCTKTKQELQASKQSALEDLPPILILHLKRFVYDMQRSTTLKVHKAVTYPMSLVISKDLLSSTAQVRIPPEGRTYRLFAVVYHHGKDTNGGHYTCDVQMPGRDMWLRYDDTDVTEVQANDVAKPVMGRDAYLLFYQRADLCKGQ